MKCKPGHKCQTDHCTLNKILANSFKSTTQETISIKCYNQQKGMLETRNRQIIEEVKEHIDTVQKAV